MGSLRDIVLYILKTSSIKELNSMLDDDEFINSLRPAYRETFKQEVRDMILQKTA